MALVAKKPLSPAELLQKVNELPSRDPLARHRKVIAALRTKDYSWRDIAEFLKEHGIETDHTRLMRFMKTEIFTVPKASQYADALNRLHDAKKGSKGQWAMLRYLYFDAHNRTASFKELSDAAGYAEGGANVGFGSFAALLGEALGMDFARRETDDPDSGPFMSSAVGSGSPYKNEDGHYQLVMHHELAKGLALLTWFKKDDDEQ